MRPGVGGITPHIAMIEDERNIKQIGTFNRRRRLRMQRERNEVVLRRCCAGVSHAAKRGYFESNKIKSP